MRDPRHSAAFYSARMERSSGRDDLKGVAQEPLRILQIGTVDEGGGAAAVARGLMRAYRARGQRVWHAVGRQCGRDTDVVVLADDHRAPYRWTGYAALQRELRRLAGHHPNRGWGLISRSLRSLTHPLVVARRMKGLEDFDFPGTYGILDLLDDTPDIVHAHNLHGDYFDLRALGWLSERVPCVLTLHDMWMLTGHCAYSLGCERWVTGCGSCPDLNLYPAVRRDATAANWQRKRDTYERSRLYVATPSQWLLDNVQRSMLAPALKEARVIPNGVDLSIFRPGDKRAARRTLGIPQDASVVLMTAGSYGSMWKDDKTLVTALKRVASGAGSSELVFIALGREPFRHRHAHALWLTPSYQTDSELMATYYQAADVYAHAARADNFPSAILEALSCGTPVVATNVGGIPEQVKSTDITAIRSHSLDAIGDATGVLVPSGDIEAFTETVTLLLDDEPARRRLGANGIRDARARFDLRQQVDTYLAWYQTIVTQQQGSRA